MNSTAITKSSDYYGLPKAEINTDMCINCDKCRKSCNFNAIKVDSEYKVDYYSCEGCGVCEAICPVGAAVLKPAVAGELMLYIDDAVFSTARLKMGSGTSGKLVSEVKKQMKSSVRNADLAIIDGSPGIGCPVIASMSGVDMVLIVTEPSISGISDMERIVETAKKFQTKTAVCVNKFDVNIENTRRIELFCKDNNLPFIGKIPFDPYAVKAINNGKSIVDIECESGKATENIFKETIKLLFNKG
nr:4Fe-4S dicluster-binding protein [Sporosalibacterium faouarense]